MSAASGTSNQKTLFNDDLEYNLSEYLQGVSNEKGAEVWPMTNFPQIYSLMRTVAFLNPI